MKRRSAPVRPSDVPVIDLPLVLVQKEVEFDAGHRVPSHGGKCRNPHGHHYKVQITCTGPVIDNPLRTDHGMVVDFSDLRLMLLAWSEGFDHAFIVWQEDTELVEMFDGHDFAVRLVPYVPTAENLARLCFEEIGPDLTARYSTDLRLVEVAVFETPTSVARYRR